MTKFVCINIYIYILYTFVHRPVKSLNNNIEGFEPGSSNFVNIFFKPWKLGHTLLIGNPLHTSPNDRTFHDWSINPSPPALLRVYLTILSPLIRPYQTLISVGGGLTSHELKSLRETLTWYFSNGKICHIKYPLRKDVHPRKLTWNLKIPPWKTRNIYKSPILGFQPLVFGGVHPWCAIWRAQRSLDSETGGRRIGCFVHRMLPRHHHIFSRDGPT